MCDLNQCDVEPSAHTHFSEGGEILCLVNIDSEYCQ